MAAPHKLVGAVESELRSRGSRKLALRWATRSLVFATGLVAAAGLLLVWHQPQPPEPRAEVRDPGTLILLPGKSDISGATSHRASVVAGTRLMAPEAAPLHLGSADGTVLTLDPGGSLTVVEAGATKRFALLRGALSVHVKKLVTGERFIVDTADAEIEVHGTTFRVAISTASSACGNGSPTRVSVSEGVVTVNKSGHDEYLRPGDEWPPDCALAAVPERAVADRPDVSMRSLCRPSHQSTSSGPCADSDYVASGASTRQAARQLGSAISTSLEAQNDLFSAAVRAKREGQIAVALRLFDRFVRTYPNSSLVESALAQQMRSLVGTDSGAAAAVATRYLARFPDGFARSEARALTVAQASP
jgi:FecR protein